MKVTYIGGRYILSDDKGEWVDSTTLNKSDRLCAHMGQAKYGLKSIQHVGYAGGDLVTYYGKNLKRAVAEW